jgi:hypothetical protein
MRLSFVLGFGLGMAAGWTARGLFAEPVPAQHATPCRPATTAPPPSPPPPPGEPEQPSVDRPDASPERELRDAHARFAERLRQVGGSGDQIDDAA